jgi:hypothetical protein
MPKKEIISIGTFSGPGVNITFSVGPGGDNGIADVILIQTLFNYIGHYNGLLQTYLGFPLDEMPEVNGICDPKTKHAILRFQRKNRTRLLSVDGLIHPASYERRNIKPAEPRLMTITLMHHYAVDMALTKGDSSYIDGLVHMVPLLGSWLS